MLQHVRIPAVAHGFRSSFRDWAVEETDHPGRSSRRRWPASCATSDAPATCLAIADRHRFAGALRGLAGRGNDSGAARYRIRGPGQGRAALKSLGIRDYARHCETDVGQTPVFIGGAQAQHGAVGSEVLIRDIPGLSGIRPGNPILAGATSFARGSDQKERVTCESCVQGTVCRNRFRSPSSPDGRVGLGVSRIRPALSHLN